MKIWEWLPTVPCVLIVWMQKCISYLGKSSESTIKDLIWLVCKLLEGTHLTSAGKGGMNTPGTSPGTQCCRQNLKALKDHSTALLQCAKAEEHHNTRSAKGKDRFNRQDDSKHHHLMTKDFPIKHRYTSCFFLHAPVAQRPGISIPILYL